MSKQPSLQLAALTLSRYEIVEQIIDAPQTLERLLTWSIYEPLMLRFIAEVRSQVEVIAHQVKMSHGATDNNVRRQRLYRAKSDVSNLNQTLKGYKNHASYLFLPIANCWEYLIDDEIDRFGAETRYRARISDPYIIDTPVPLEQASLFALRSDLITVVQSALNTVHNKPTLVLYGPRGMGKSTFLMHLPRLLPDEVVPIFISLRQATQEGWSGGLYYNWVTIAHQTIQKRYHLDIPHPILADFGLKPAAAFQEWLEKVEHSLAKRKLFFTFDEFECLVAAIEKNPVMEEIFSILGRLSKDRPFVYLLFAGMHQLKELALDGHWYSYFNNIHPLEIFYLDEADAVRLLTKPIPDFPLDYEPDAVTEAIRLTHCHPMLVQLMGSILVNWFNDPNRGQQQSWGIVTPEDVAYAAQVIIQEGRFYFRDLWSDTKETEQQVLRIITRTPNGLTKVELMRETGLSPDDLSVALAWLEQYRLVEQIENHWRIQVELVRRAFAELAQIKGEIASGDAE